MVSTPDQDVSLPSLTIISTFTIAILHSTNHQADPNPHQRKHSTTIIIHEPFNQDGKGKAMFGNHGELLSCLMLKIHCHVEWLMVADAMLTSLPGAPAVPALPQSPSAAPPVPEEPVPAPPLEKIDNPKVHGVVAG